MTPPAPPLLSLAECTMFDENEMEDENLYFIAKAFKDTIVLDAVVATIGLSVTYYKIVA